MTSIGDSKIALQLPLTSATQALEQVIGDAAIATAQAIGGSDLPPAPQDVTLLPTAGIAAYQTDPSGSASTGSADTDFTTQGGSSDAFMGMRPPASDASAQSLSLYQQLASMMSAASSVDEPRSAEQPTDASPEANAGASPTDPQTAAPNQTAAVLAKSSPIPAQSAAEMDQKPHGADQMMLASGEASSEATADHAASPNAAQTTIDARLDGSLLATKVIDERPDAPQMLSAGVISNALAAAMRETASSGETAASRADMARPSDAADLAGWQIGIAGAAGSFAAIDVGAKQTAAWSDARDQSDQSAQLAEQSTRAAAETNGFEDPRPAQSIATGALVGAVLSGPETADARFDLAMQSADQLSNSADIQSGIMASSVLNAAMIPGWPQTQLSGKSASEVVLAQMNRAPGMSDEEMLTYLTNLGADDAMLAKVRKALGKPGVGRKLTFYLASLATAMSVVFKSLAGELEVIMDEDAETAAARQRADSRGKERKRQRLYLE